MIDLPLNVDCMAKVLFENTSVIQKIKLSRLDDILDRLPKGTTVEILSFKDEIVSWSPIVKLKAKCRVRMPITVFKVAKFGLMLPKPVDRDIRIVHATPSILPRSALTAPTLIQGLVCADSYRSGRIEHVRSGKNRKATIQTFLHNKKRYINIPYTLYINDCEFDTKYYVENINDIIYDYVTLHSTCLGDVYLTELMLRNSLLIPLIFNKGFDISRVVDVDVPYELNWMLYLLYGNEKRITSKLKYKNGYSEYCIPELEIKSNTWIARSRKLQLSLEDDRLPVIINNNIPMVFT